MQSQSVAVTDYVISGAKTSLTVRNNNPSTIRIESIFIDGRECWLQGGHSQPQIQPVLRMGESQTIQCNSFASTTRFDVPIEINYKNVQTNTIQTVRDVALVGLAASFTCPIGFVPVPGGFVLADGSTVPDFCVSKYEMKWDGTGSIGIPEGMYCGSGQNYNDNSCLSGNPGIRSAPDSLPLTAISFLDAQVLCQQMGGGSGKYDIISDRQWMVIAENILHTPINDLNSSAPGVQLARGHTDGNPSARLAAGPDPDMSQCVISHSLDDNLNTNCGLRGPQGYIHTNNNWDETYAIFSGAGDRGRDQLRIHVLSNGHLIWDFSGNIETWTSPYTGATIQTSDYNESVDYTNILWAKPSANLSPTLNGAGRISVASTPRVITRGGRFQNTLGQHFAGIFAFHGANTQTNAWAGVGFRCVYQP